MSYKLSKFSWGLSQISRSQHAGDRSIKEGWCYVPEGDFFNVKPASEYEKKTKFDIVFGESNVTDKERVKSSLISKGFGALCQGA